MKEDRESEQPERYMWEPRVGLLTFEHQGCPQYEMEEEEEMDEEEATTEESTPPEPNPAKTLTVRDCRVLVVDEPLSALIPFLEDQQFSARPLTPGMDEQIAKPNTNGTIFDLCGQLGERFLVTDRTEVFRHAAAVCGFSIIDTAQYTRDPQSVVEEIAERWILLHMRGSVPYILRLRNHDQPVIERVE